MSTYTDASLIMFPSGYKEDKIYSLKPTDGSGDLTFTRASTATRVNAEGLIETSPVNLTSYSEQFDNAAWTKNKSIVTANSIAAPNGTITADLITSTSTSETGVYYFPAVIGTNTWSIYAKKGTGRYLFFNTNNPPNIAAKFDLQDGVIVGTPQAGATPSIESVGNGWYRCIITSSISENRFTAFITDNTTTDNLNSSVGLTYYLWGAQLNIGATAKPYFPTTDRLNVPRIDYTGGGCGSLLLEKQSTNVLTQSNALTGVSGTTATVNNATSPDGTQNAILINGASGYAYAGTSNNFGGGVTSTFSAFIKYKQGIGQASIGIGGQFAAYLYIDGLDDGNIVLTNYAGSGVSGLTTGYEVHANGWYRFWLTATYTGTAGYQEWQISSNTTNTHLWYYGGQNEASSYMTSFIFTSGSSVTRLADSASKTGISSLIGGTSGTVFFDIKTNPVLSSANYKQFFYYTDSSANQGYMYLNSGNGIITNPPFGNLSSSITLSPNTRYKIALTYANNDFALYVNGTSVATASSGTTWNFENLLSLGSYTGTAEFNEFVFNQYTHFKSRLTNAELASLTTL